MGTSGTSQNFSSQLEGQLTCPPVPCFPRVTQGAGLSWLFPFVDGHPPIGWANAGYYLVLPVLLVASQYLSMKIVSPPQNKDDPAVQQSQAILKFLPLMIGACSLRGAMGRPSGCWER